MGLDQERVFARPLSGEKVSPLPSGLIPARAPLEGTGVRLEPIDPNRHAEELYAASHADDRAREVWRYMAYGPFDTLDGFRGFLRDCAAQMDPIFYAIRDKSVGTAKGVASYLNIAAKNGSIEIGHIWFGPALQRTRAASEAMYLMLRYALDDLRYRRMEWKCNALNEASRRAALRLGFRFEGIFYQHQIVKGHNRDTAWYSIMDHEWPALRANMEAWLAPTNFDAKGHPKQSLTTLNRERR